MSDNANRRLSAIPGSVGLDIADCDADGLGKRIVCVYGPEQQEAARLLLVASRVSGGWQRAMEILRAEIVKEAAHD